MKISVTHVKRAVVAGSIFGFLLFPSIGTAEPVTIQTEGNPSNAFAGESGASISSSALISVLVTSSTGAQLNSLGSNVGNGTSQIALPSGWTLQPNFNSVPGACPIIPTGFSNAGQGIYTIRVVPLTSNANCRWLSGDYHYVVQIKGTFSNSPFSASGLGVLTIP